MKILVLGATGMAGHMISLYLTKKDHDVLAVTRKTFPYCNNVIGDIQNFEFFESLFKENEYDAVINCIGVLNEDANDLKKSIFINSLLPHLIAEKLEGTKTKLIHLSTDCVFSGLVGNYDEMSIPDGLTIYDKTKSLGEVIDNKNLTFRNSIIGPDVNLKGIGLFNWFMKQKGPINGFSKVLWTGVTTLELARAIEQAIIQDISGLYHLVNNSNISKFDLLSLFNKHFNDNSIPIRKFEDLHVDKTLINTRKDFNFSVKSYDEMIYDMKIWISDNKYLYDHYVL
ncbi:SDR family oxidoreductase [Algoriphagus aquimarinus]|uniref:dTDP-4-dehydrorhamnose reductase n=1 Tax=Algoriphagus aquimarinus TaxID=237018 RepID=A0A1I1AW34_9BACT|nr:SDR family oxidoreductase [Algoriphagus aquimarinus]SFB41752.1 dTDP-4-dehydrorhamnose reductase [Algoriphagus aquimarinus]